VTEPDHLAGYVPPGPARRWFRRAIPAGTRQAAWTLAMRTPGLKRVWPAFDPSHRDRRVTRRTALVIDGYPRSGNTYARAAFDYANGTTLRVSSHTHDPAAIIRATKYRLPTLVLIRDPLATMASMVQFDPRHEASLVQENWCLYYSMIEPYLDRVVLADFPETVGDFGEVTRRLNAKFGTSFTPYRRTEEAEQALVEVIDNVARTHEPDRFVDAVSRPSASRRSAEDVVAELDASERTLLAKAEEMHARLLERFRD
jgi:hypothetical protein